jgi:hypothetical protein
VVYRVGLKLMNRNVRIPSIYYHKLEKLEFLPMFITLHCNIMLIMQEELNQYILTCDIDSNTANIETDLSIIKNLINV